MGEHEGWLSLAFTLDGCSRRCVAHHCREDMRAELATTTFTLAAARQPPPPGLLHHSDRGVQYAAEAFAQPFGHELRAEWLTAAWGVTRSMSRAGNPYDNALAESFEVSSILRTGVSQTKGKAMSEPKSKFARRYDREFKENAVALVNQGRSQGEVSRDLGVSAGSLGEWVKKAKAGQALKHSKTLDPESAQEREPSGAR